MSYISELLITIDLWHKEPIEDEWLFERFRDENIEKMTELEAFESISETIDILLSEADESTACEIVQTLINLATKSCTTEVPIKLMENKKNIEQQFSEWSEYAIVKLKELFKYYRLI